MMRVAEVNGRLTRWQKAGLVVLVVALGVLGSFVVMRSALMSRRMGDYDCFARAGWAVRTGQNMYDVTDDNGFHYNYPPLFAILMAPLADPPRGVAAPGMIAYPVSVAIWYLISLVLLAMGTHWLASALEKRASDPVLRRPLREGCRWWTLRLLPVLACAIPIGHTLMRGQANFILLFCFCGLAACTLRGQPWRAGLCLAGAILLKVFPTFLLIYPLWRRDYRCLAGCVAGLLVGGLVIPAAVLGLPKTVADYKQFATVTLAPGLGLGHDASRAKELIAATATDSQSLQVVLHNSLHAERASRPAWPSSLVRWSARLLGGLLTLVTLWAVGRRAGGSGSAAALLCGCLVLVMLLLSPVCHLHYFSMLVPLVMALIMTAWEHRPGRSIGLGLAALLVANVVGSVLPNLPGMEPARDLGLVMYLGLAFWLLGVWTLRRLASAESGPTTLPATPTDLAA